MRWSNALVGVSYGDKGRSPLIGLPVTAAAIRSSVVDCWGLTQLGFWVGAGIVVPSYDQDYLSADEAREIDAIVRREEESPLWKRVTGEPREFDVLWFARGKIERHCGLCVQPGVMLHIEERRGQSRHDDYRKTSDLGLRLTSIYRWHELAR